MVRFTGVDHFALTVTDLEVSTRFYRDVLDFLPSSTSGKAGCCCTTRPGSVSAC